MSDLGAALSSALPLCVTGGLLGLALWEVAKGWRVHAEAKLEKVRLRRAELDAEERERARREPPARKAVEGFLRR